MALDFVDCDDCPGLALPVDGAVLEAHPAVSVVNTEACRNIVSEGLCPSRAIIFIKELWAEGDNSNDESQLSFAAFSCACSFDQWRPLVLL